MPYRHANYFVGFVVAVILIGFWPSYYSSFFEVPAAFHAHATTSMAWVLLLMVQVWAIHHGRNRLHRTLGKASLALFPLLIVGFVSIINVSARRFSAGDDPGIAYLAPSFGIGMAMAIVAYLVLYYLALAKRRNVYLHAGFMLMTPAILFESAFSRILLGLFPGLIFTGSTGPQIVIDAIVISMGLAVIFCLALYAVYRKHGAPFLIAAGLIAVQAVLMYIAPNIGWIREGFAAYARLPEIATLVGGFGLGAFIAWRGWEDGGRPRLVPRPSPAE